MSQIERNEVITNFKKKEMPILVATDVAGKENLFRSMKRFQCLRKDLMFLVFIVGG